LNDLQKAGFFSFKMVLRMGSAQKWHVCQFNLSHQRGSPQAAVPKLVPKSNCLREFQLEGVFRGPTEPTEIELFTD